MNKPSITVELKIGKDNLISYGSSCHSCNDRPDKLWFITIGGIQSRLCAVCRADLLKRLGSFI